MQFQITREKAIELADSKWWEGKTPQEIVQFQLFTAQLCMPFPLFHKNVEEALNRPVFTHEFAFLDSLIKEFLGEKPAPSFEEIMELIPADKRIIVQL